MLHVTLKRKPGIAYFKFIELNSRLPFISSMEFRPLCRSSNARIPSRLKAFSHSPDLLPGPLAPNPRVRWSRTSSWCRSSSKAHSRHRIVSLLGGNSFGFGLSICLLSFSLPISRLQPTGDLPTCGPANRNAYITCKDVGAAAGVFAPLLPFLLGSCPALQTQPGNTQHNRLAAHLNRVRSLLALAGPALDFFRRWRHQRRRRGRPLRPSSPAPPSVFPYLTTSLSPPTTL